MALVVISCSKDETAHSNLRQGITLTATTASETRTSFDGNATTWVAGDKMAVLIAGNNYQIPAAHTFELADETAGRFTNATAEVEPTAQYNFYAVYPHDATIDATNATATLSIGAASQTQNGNSPAHIAALDPLTGYVAEALPTDISIAMRHNAAVLAMTIKNSLTDEIGGIASVKIEAPEGVALCGKYEVALADNAISTAAETSNSVTINISDSGALAADGEFKVYAAIAPVTLAAGQSLQFIITTTDEQTYTINKEFAAGRVISAADLLSTTLTITAQELPEEMTFEFDFTDISIYPAGFPTGIDDSTKEGVLYYQFNNYSFNGQAIKLGFENEGGYYRSSTDGYYISFRDITTSSSAKIYLPQIEGYSISSITINKAGKASFQGSLYDNSGNLIYMKGAEGYVTSKNIGSSTTGTTMELSTPTAVNYINVSGSSHFNCKGITLTYVKNS